jgi:hypothetical protein
MTNLAGPDDGRWLVDDWSILRCTSPHAVSRRNLKKFSVIQFLRKDSPQSHRGSQREVLLFLLRKITVQGFVELEFFSVSALCDLRASVVKSCLDCGSAAPGKKAICTLRGNST